MREKKNHRPFLPLPKEHGSWAMWSVPLVIGLAASAQVSAQWQWRSVLLIVASLGFFLLRFPVDLLIKTRKRPTTDRMWLIRWASVYGAVTAISGLWLVVVDQLYGLLLLGAVGALLLAYHWWLVEKRQEMSAPGELAGIVALALGAPLAYYTASGQLGGTAVLLWLVNALYFGGTVFYIKLKVRQQPREPRPDRVSERLIKARACLTYQSVVLTVACGLVGLLGQPLLLLLAFVPMTVKMVYGAMHWQDKKSLSLPRLGVIEIVHAALFAMLIIIAFWAAG